MFGFFYFIFISERLHLQKLHIFSAHSVSSTLNSAPFEFLSAVGEVQSFYGIVHARIQG